MSHKGNQKIIMRPSEVRNASQWVLLEWFEHCKKIGTRIKADRIGNRDNL